MTHTSCSCPLCVPGKYQHANPVGTQTYQVPSLTPSQYGWICPKCQNVYSPALTECYKCNGSQFQVIGTSVNINAVAK